jgi:hypothetical protein
MPKPMTWTQTDSLPNRRYVRVRDAMTTFCAPLKGRQNIGNAMQDYARRYDLNGEFSAAGRCELMVCGWNTETYNWTVLTRYDGTQYMGELTQI